MSISFNPFNFNNCVSAQSLKLSGIFKRNNFHYQILRLINLILLLRLLVEQLY